MDQIKKAGNDAREYYKNGKWLCSEAVVTVINDFLGQAMPQEVVKMASGFPVGIGCAGCTCGALTGGVMALGLVFGRTEAGADNSYILRTSKELHDWFIESYGSTCCRVLIKDFQFGESEHIEQCTNITGSVTEYIASLIRKDKQV